MQGYADREGEEVAKCAHDVPLVSHPGESVASIPGFLVTRVNSFPNFPWSSVCNKSIFLESDHFNL